MLTLKYEDDECGLRIRGFMCSSKSPECLDNYRLLTKLYECRLRKNQMTLAQYSTQYNPSLEIGDKLYSGEIDVTSKEYLDDKVRRMQNFAVYGSFEPLSKN